MNEVYRVTQLGNVCRLDLSLESCVSVKGEPFTAYRIIARSTITARGTRKLGTMSKQKQLIDAIYKEDCDIVAFLLNEGANPNRPFKKLLPLVEAARIGHEELVELLIAQKAQIDQTEEVEGHSALTVACSQGHLQVVNALINHGSNVNLCRGGVASPLTDAASRGGKARSVLVKRLLAAGASPTTVFISQYGVPVKNVLMSACESADSEIVQLLIEAGAKVNEQLFFGTALTAAVGEGRTETVKLLLQYGANPHLAVPNDPQRLRHAGRTPLEIARKGGYRKIISLLEDHIGSSEGD